MLQKNSVCIAFFIKKFEISRWKFNKEQKKRGRLLSANILLSGHLLCSVIEKYHFFLHPSWLTGAV